MSIDQPAGWRPDPDDSTKERWWDGSGFTTLSRSATPDVDKAPEPAPPPYVAPVVAPPAPPPVGDPAEFDRAPWPAAVGGAAAGGMAAGAATIIQPAVASSPPGAAQPQDSGSKKRIALVAAGVLLLAILGSITYFAFGSDKENAGPDDSTTTTGIDDASSSTSAKNDDSTSSTTETSGVTTIAPTTKRLTTSSSSQPPVTPGPTPPGTVVNPTTLSPLPAGVPSTVTRNLQMETWVTVIQSGMLSEANTLGDVNRALSTASGAGYDAGLLYTNDYPSLRQDVLAAYVGPFGSCVEAKAMAEQLKSAGLGFTEDSTYQRKISTDPSYQDPLKTKC